jgi:NagD protein
MKSIISDMDGVIYRGKALIPGAREFIERLQARAVPFLFLTNNSEQTPLDLQRKLEGLGLPGLTEKNFITSAMATAKFLAEQRPHATCYVIGGAGLVSELYKVGFSISESRPDYVVVGKTASVNYDMLKKAARFVTAGAKFIGTNPDVVDPVEGGSEPAAGTLLAAIETATGRKPYVVGKPNALMMLMARRQLGSHASDTVMIGDRMDTDVVAGLEAGMTTCLVLSGVSTAETLDAFPYRPHHVFNHVGEIDPEAL